PFSYHELEDSLELETELTPMHNVKMLPSKVNMRIGVEQLTQKTVEVPVTPVNVPEGLTLRTFPRRVKVTFQTVISEYEPTTSNDFTVEADYSSVVPGTESIKPVITRYPSSARHMSLSPRVVEFIIEQQ
ncbi:MAG: hypothetical protein KBT15_06245, partial [Bacteroidales bacterium]|nr:hypothetical protein [Candidatus Minthousia equi]